MLIRIGFEIAVDCPKPTPMLLALYPHPANGRRMIGADHIRVEPDAAVGEFTDMFGNRCGRFQAPPGETILWSDYIVADSGEPDAFNRNARQHEIADLPAETLSYLTASRYCESDELVEQAWDLFGATPPGRARARTIPPCSASPTSPSSAPSRWTGSRKRRETEVSRTEECIW